MTLVHIYLISAVTYLCKNIVKRAKMKNIHKSKSQQCVNDVYTLFSLLVLNATFHCYTTL